MQDFEKLGAFYLGREYNLKAQTLQENLLLYDARDLTTHAVVVGMTGSGKTGLCINLIEEAAIDGIPSILIDPKGDLTNLLLTFPALSGEDFAPWINPEDAARKGLSPADYAKAQAALWQKGLAEWGQDAARIQRLRQAAEFVVYTPGSSAGIPVSILKSFAAPPPELREDSELFQERIETSVESLLGLLGIAADPLQSREHIFLATIFNHIWSQGLDLDLAALIGFIQTPPLTRIGVLDLESFYPAKERFGLVMALNNLLASPGFAAWMEGQPLEIANLLHTPQGKPRVAIFSIAHLSDNERMFFVSMLLNQTLGWMRTQPGTSSLRALLYMDEIFGYFPPSANPPSKKPLLTLLKQARAFGLGVVLATQNPVDLDYKGLSNAGTWFIGRLQTERDKARVMEGLEGAAASAGSAFDRAKMEQTLAGLGSRVFLMNNTHEDAPVVFQTRWCMSYLRGPLTRAQIKQLMGNYQAETGPAGRSAPAAAPAPQPGAAAAAGTQPPLGASAASAGAAPLSAEPAGGARPTLPAEITQFFLPLRGGGAKTYRPLLLGAAQVRFSDTKTRAETSRLVLALTPLHDAVLPVDWNEAREPEGLALNDLEKTPAPGLAFDSLPAAAFKPHSFVEWQKDFVSWVYGAQKLTLWRSPSSGLVSQPDESERDFRVRMQQAAREARDAQVEALRRKYAPKVAALQEKVRRAEQAVMREEEQAKNAMTNTAISFGATLLGAFTGRKLASASNLSKAATAMKGVGHSVQQSGDVSRAKQTLEAFKQQAQTLEDEFAAESAALKARSDPLAEILEPVTILPKKSDINTQFFGLVWQAD